MAEPGNAPVILAKLEIWLPFGHLGFKSLSRRAPAVLTGKTRELIYSKLPLVLQNLLPNKTIAEYEIHEDKKLATIFTCHD